ncbi:MAG: hypothetical protein EBV28_10575, partial [Betaproteobacteria bacterium]|nr:hypothetical protein [Betaproteobacteria bacterium]
VMATFAHAVNPSLVTKLPFDTERAFATVGMVARGPNVLVVRTDSSLKSLRDVLEQARAYPQASNKLRALGVTSPERSPVWPHIPAIAEFVPGYSVESWYGLLAPAGTPSDVVARLHMAMVQATQWADFKRKLELEGLMVDASTPQEFDAYIRREEARWRRIVKDNRIKPD